MANQIIQTSYKETADQFGKESEIYKNVFDSTEGTYEIKTKVAQAAVLQYQRTMLGEKFRNQLASQLAKFASVPETGAPAPELMGLNREKVTAWLDQYQENLNDALVVMFHLDPKYKMTDDELALFTDELKNPDHIKQKTFFSLSSWLNRVKRDSKSVEVDVDEADEAAVVDDILSEIINDQPPAGLGAKNAA